MALSANAGALLNVTNYYFDIDKPDNMRKKG
jgi:hypothetical protein